MVMRISDSELENDLRRIAAIVDDWGLRCPAKPRQPETARIRETLDEMAADGAPQAPKLFRYFELVEELGLDAIFDFISYYDACTTAQAQHWRTQTIDAELRVVGVVNDELVQDKPQNYYNFGKCLVAVAENESWGYAVDCGLANPGPVYSFDKFGMHWPCFGSLNDMVHALRLAYEGQSPFEGDWPFLSPHGELEWTMDGE